MADFSLTTLFVVPVGQEGFPSSGSTQDLAPGEVGFFNQNYSAIDVFGVAPGEVGVFNQGLNNDKYFYVAQGRENSYLQGTKRSDKIIGEPSLGGSVTNVTEAYMVKGCATSVNQITDIAGFNVTCGESVTLTLRAHSSYIDTLYFNGFTRSVTVQAPCCDCGADPCDTVDVPALIDQLIAALGQTAPGTNPDNISFSSFYDFERVGDDAEAILRIHGKALTKYGQPCDVAAFPYEYDRMWFRAFVYTGPATTADFIVADNCNIVAEATVTQRSSYPTGTPDEIRQLEKDYYSYQAGYLKHLYRMNGYNGNFESQVADGVVYDTFYVKFNSLDKSAGNWGDYIPEDSMVIIAIPQSELSSIFANDVWKTAFYLDGYVNGDCITTTTTTTVSP